LVINEAIYCNDASLDLNAMTHNI